MDIQRKERFVRWFSVFSLVVSLVALVLSLCACSSGPSQPLTPEQQAQRAIWAQAVMNGSNAVQQSLSRQFTTCYTYNQIGMVWCP